MSNKNLLIIFAKNPEIGKVKTRLSEIVGKEKALKIYNFLFSYTLAQCNKVKGCEQHIYYSDNLSITHNEDLLSKKFIQQGKSLGERMKNAFETSFSMGYKKIVLIGSDCPEILSGHIEKAFEILKTKNTVFGPANDGGYYLIGMQKMFSLVFENMPWSSNLLMNKTNEVLDNEHISYKLLERLSDVDTIEDAQKFNLL